MISHANLQQLHIEPPKRPAFDFDADLDQPFDFDADPDSAFHFNADPDLLQFLMIIIRICKQFCVEPQQRTAFAVVWDLDRAFDLDANPDPAFDFDADPDSSFTLVQIRIYYSS
jgi:hypothetical protein